MSLGVRSSVLELHVPMRHTTRVGPILDSVICVALNIMEEWRRERREGLERTFTASPARKVESCCVEHVPRDRRDTALVSILRSPNGD